METNRLEEFIKSAAAYNAAVEAVYSPAVISIVLVNQTIGEARIRIAGV